MDFQYREPTLRTLLGVLDYLDFKESILIFLRRLWLVGLVVYKLNSESRQTHHTASQV